MSNVTVEYSNFTKDDSFVEKISFELLPDITLELTQSETEADEDGNTTQQLTITMTSEDSEEAEITGVLDEDALNALVRSLIIFRGQLS